METVVGTEGGQRRHIAEAGIVRLVLLGGNRRRGAVDHFQFTRFGEHDALAHVGNDLVRHDHNRGTVFFRQIEGADGLFEDFLYGSRDKADGRMVAVGAPLGAHDVRL